MAKDLSKVRGHVEVLQYAKREIAKLKELESMARDAIEAELGNDDIGQLDGATVITWVAHKKRQFQQKKLAEAHPELAAEFTELVEQRTFKLVDPA